MALKELDNTDATIIRYLQEDGRATNKSIAKELSVSEETVRRRVKRLSNQEYFKVAALPDAAKMGFEIEALIGVTAEPDKLDDVADAIAGLAEANMVSVVTGAFDIVVFATLHATEDLSRFLRQDLGSISGVQRVETFVCIENKKRSSALVV